MSETSVSNFNNNIQVQFVGYSVCFEPDIYYCVTCFEEKYIEVTGENEHLYLSVCFKNLSQFTDSCHRDKSNYCATCTVPLYNIDRETCQHSSPTSKKWLQRFQINRLYGLRGGGI